MGKWNDFLARFKKPAATDNPDDYIDISPGADKPDAIPAPPPKTSWLTRWSPGARRDRQIAWLQAGYSEMLSMMRGINDHLQRQEDVQHKMVDVLERLPDSMDGLKSVGKAAEQQVEVLALLRNQLDSSVRHDQQLVESMNQFNRTLGVMDETTRNSGRTVAELIEKSRSADQLLREVVDRSEKRFLLMTVLFLLAVIVGVSAILYSTTHAPREAAPVEEPAVVTPALVTHANQPPAVSAQIEAPAADEAITEEESAPRRGFFQRMFHREPEPQPEPETTETE